MERLLDRLLLSVDLDLLLPRVFGERVRDRLLRVGDRDLDLRILVRDLDRDRLRLVLERDLRRRAGVRDLDRLFFLSDGERDSLFLTGDLDLDCFLLDIDLDVDRRGDEVERDSFLGSTGDFDLESCFVCIWGDAEPVELPWHLDVILTGEEESFSSSEPSEQSDPSALGATEPDLDLETSRSSKVLGGSICSLSLLEASCSCNWSKELPAWGPVEAAEEMGFQSPC